MSLILAEDLITYCDAKITLFTKVFSIRQFKFYIVGVPLPKPKYGNGMGLSGPYLTHRWEWYGKVRW